jgi:hypothetical protein
VDVDRTVQELHDRLDQPRMGGQAAEGGIEGVGGKDRAHRLAVPLAPDLGPLLGEEIGQLPAQD